MHHRPAHESQDDHDLGQADGESCDGQSEDALRYEVLALVQQSLEEHEAQQHSESDLWTPTSLELDERSQHDGRDEEPPDEHQHGHVPLTCPIATSPAPRLTPTSSL